MGDDVVHYYRVLKPEGMSTKRYLQLMNRCDGSIPCAEYELMSCTRGGSATGEATFRFVRIYGS